MTITFSDGNVREASEQPARPAPLLTQLLDTRLALMARRDRLAAAFEAEVDRPIRDGHRRETLGRLVARCLLAVNRLDVAIVATLDGHGRRVLWHRGWLVERRSTAAGRPYLPRLAFIPCPTAGELGRAVRPLRIADTPERSSDAP